MPWPLNFPTIAVEPAAGRGVSPTASTIPADAPLGLYRLVGYTGFTEPTFEVVA